MAIIEDVSDAGLEVLKKAAKIPDDSVPTRLSLRTETKIAGSSGNIAEVNSSGQLHVVTRGKVDVNNSTTTPLTSGATYTGTSTDVLDYAIIYLTIHTDAISATDGLCLQVSNNNTDWHNAECFTVQANTNKTFSFQCDHQYVRTKYTNGGTNQTTFELTVILKKTNSKPSSHRIQDSIVDDDDAELMKSVLTAKRTSDSVFTNINATPSGNLQVTDAENGLAIAKGEVTGTSYVHKFGATVNFGVAAGFATVWDGANDGGINAMQYTYSITDDIDGISSSSVNDTEEITVQGLDINYALVTQTITLTGQTKAPLGTNLIRVFRMFNANGTPLVGDVYCSTSAATLSGGIPTVATTVRALIQIQHGQTLMAVYTIPAGKTAYLRGWYGTTAGAKRTSVHVIHVAARSFGGVFLTKHVSSIVASGTGHIHYKYSEPAKYLEKTDIEIHMNTDEADASVSAGFDIVLVDN